MPELYRGHAAFFDFDDTIADTNRLWLHAQNVLRNLGFDPQLLVEAEEEAAQNGEDFDPVEFIVTNYGLWIDTTPEAREERFKKPFTQLHSSSRNNLKMKDGDALLLEVSQTAQCVSILTYGFKKWQEMKIQATGHEGLSRRIVRDRDKTDLIQREYALSGQGLLIPVADGTHLPVRNAVLFDDNERNFESLDENGNVYGIHIVHDMPKMKGGESLVLDQSKNGRLVKALGNEGARQAYRGLIDTGRLSI